MDNNLPTGSGPAVPGTNPQPGVNPYTGPNPQPVANPQPNPVPPTTPTSSAVNLRDALTPKPANPTPSVPASAKQPPPSPMSVQQPPGAVGQPLTNKSPVPGANVGAPPPGPSVSSPPVSTPPVPAGGGKNMLRFVKLGAIFVIIVAILVGVVFFLRTRGTISSYEECAQDPDSVIQEGYPEVCVTVDGEYFEKELSEQDNVDLNELSDGGEVGSPVDTSDWIAYSNAIYGYQIKYPADYTFEQITSEFSSLVMRELSDGVEPTGGVSLTFQVFALDGNDVETVVDEAVSQFQSLGIATIVSAKQPTLVGNLSGFTYTTQGLEVTKYNYVALPDGQNYLLTIDTSSDPNGNGYLNSVDEIISSITFTGAVAQQLDVTGVVDQQLDVEDMYGEQEFEDEIVCGGVEDLGCPLGYGCFYNEVDDYPEGICIEDFN